MAFSGQTCVSTGGRLVAILALFLGLPACMPPRHLVTTVALAKIAARGGGARSAVVRFRVPPRSRCIAAQASGDRDALLWLASLRVAGREVIAVQAPTPTADPRLQTFTFVYPFAPGQPLPAGPIELTVASDRAAPRARLHVLTPPDDGAHVLHLNLLTVSRRAQALDAAALIGAAQALLGQAGLRLRVDRTLTLRDTPWAVIDTTTWPWEAPGGPAAQFAALGAARVHNGALNVYIVDRLPPGSEGLSLGAPGPVLPFAPYYAGVVVARSEPATMGRVLAHELAHYLGLPHVRTVTPDGVAHEDAIADTWPGSGNLMEHGTRLTPGQAFVLSRSPLLRRD